MKATGIVRRIDDLGRVVIPKEIRRTLRMQEGAPLEIYTDGEGQVILKKYSPLGELGDFAQIFAESMAQCTNYLACITDLEQVIAASGPGKKEFAEQPLTKQFQEMIGRRESGKVQSGERNFIKIISEQEESYHSQVISPIISEGDLIGAVVLLTKENGRKPGEVELKIAQCVSTFLGRQME